MKIMIIDFTRHNPWGTTDRCTHYYVDGKRVKKNDYYKIQTYKYNLEKQLVYSKTKDGIDRDYVVNWYSEKKKNQMWC